MNWQKLTNPDQNLVQELSQLLNVPELIAVLLAQRGIQNFEEAKQFFRPQWEALHNPF